ncbi:MAG: glycosyltransferase family 4 protein [Lachnospiraceae bacterium]|nr:glycosyltransferase family 4 protein [Lachnospiraceae bacterium]
MRIVIDCFKLVKGNGKSIGIYNLTLNLVRNLAKYRKPEDKIIILGTQKNREDFAMKGVKFVSVKYNPLNKVICILWELWMVSATLKRLHADVVLFPRGFAPIRHVTKDFVIIHDMIPFYYEEKFPGVLGKYENAYIMWRLKASAKSVHGVITDSEASKLDIVKYAKVKEEKVHVVYPGANKVIAPCETAGFAKKPYISAIASGLPHKNADKVLLSYNLYRHRSASPMDLHLIGLDEKAVKELLAEHCRNVPDDLLSHIHTVKFYEKDEDMQRVIAESSMFLFLSRKEGFGFPPLEAMQMGVPVVCSDSSSLPEVVGDAAILVDAEEEEDVVNAMLLMEEAKVAAEYIRKGAENVKRFNWKKQTADYRRVIVR